jgi:fibro-slime domain-containing protein
MIKSVLKTWIGTLGIAFTMVRAQTIPLKAIVRDFYEQRSSVTDSREHPHFEPTLPATTYDAKTLGIDIVQNNIVTNGSTNATLQSVDSVLYRLDSRNPVLVQSLDSRMAWEYNPVGRFSDWYNDVPTGDVNRTFLYPLTLTYNASTGLYEYSNHNFFPLDNLADFQRLGNNAPYGKFYTNNLPASGTAHVFGFTLEMHFYFTFHAGQNQKLVVTGDDDIWVFVNGRKFEELGGIHSAQQDSIILTDAKAAQFGLVDGGLYIFDLFFAEREIDHSVLTISTNMVLSQTTAVFPARKNILNRVDKDKSSFRVDGRHIDLRSKGLPVNTTVIYRKPD